MNYKDGHFNCHACNAKQAVKFPIEVSEYTLAMKKFINAHGDCKTKEVKHEEKRD
jgi:hypothetical protein